MVYTLAEGFFSAFDLFFGGSVKIGLKEHPSLGGF